MPSRKQAVEQSRVGFFRAMEAAVGVKCIGDRSLGHHSLLLPPQLVDGTNPSRSGQLRGGQGDKTGVAAVRERFWIAKQPLLTHLPVQAQPQSLIPWEWGVLGTPRAFYPEGEQRGEIGGWSEHVNGHGGAARSWWAEPPAQHTGQFAHDLPQTAPSCCTRLSPPEPCEPRS